jgi:serine O-acetyltransferase
MKIIEDYKAFTEGGGLGKKLATLFLNPCFHSVCVFRLSNALYKMHLSAVSRVLWYINRVVFNVDIDYRAELAGGFVLVHGLGTVVGKNVRSLGKLRVYQGVTLGGSRGKCRDTSEYGTIDMPVLEDGVCVYTNACVFGPVIVSENTVIKAGKIIAQDV